MYGRLQAQLGEGMALIAQHDFPAKWEALLPDLVSKIEAALGACGLELWEMYGHGPDATQMWSEKYTSWKSANPPPLERIGDMTITAWRKRERELATSR